MPAGQPTTFTKEIGQEICTRLSQGESIRKISADEHMPPSSTIYNWLCQAVRQDKPELKEFLEQYRIAREAQAEFFFEEIKEIGDEASTIIVGDDKSDGARVQAAKLRVDVRKWAMSKIAPKKYGDKLDVTSGDKPIKGNTIIFSDFKNEADSK